MSVAMRFPSRTGRPAGRIRHALFAAAAAVGVVVLLAGSAIAQTSFSPFRLDAERPVGWLGITIQDVGEELADQLASRFGPAAGIGVLVVETLKGGPAESAGLRRGDVIVALDGKPVWDVRQLQQRVRSAPVGAQVVATLLRDRVREQVPVLVLVGRMPDDALAMLLGEALGFSVRATLQDGLRAADRRGPGEPQQPQLVITVVDPRSPARAAGLRPMDVVVEVDGQAVTTLRDLYGALRAAAAKPSFPLAVTREGARVVLTLAPGLAPSSP